MAEIPKPGLTPEEINFFKLAMKITERLTQIPIADKLLIGAVHSILPDAASEAAFGMIAEMIAELVSLVYASHSELIILDCDDLKKKVEEIAGIYDEARPQIVKVKKEIAEAVIKRQEDNVNLN